MIILFGGTGLDDPLMVKAVSFAEAQKTVIPEVRKLLPDKTNLYLESVSKGRYTLVSSFDDVGKVRVECVSDQR